MKTLFKTLMLAVLLIAACSVPRFRERPQANLPTSFSANNLAGKATLTDTASVADLSWKLFFREETLRSLIDSALKRNYSLQEALVNIRQSQVMLRRVNWDYVPELNYQITASTTRPSDNSLTGLSLASYNITQKHVEDYSSNFQLSWEADIWSKIRYRKGIELAAYLQKVESRRAIQTAIVNSIAQGYYNLLMLDAQVEIAQKNIKLSDSTVRIIKLQYDAGQVTSLAVQQALAQQLAAQQLIPSFEQNIGIQENALAHLAGRLPEHIIRNEHLESLKLPLELSAGLPASILDRRPDVHGAELAVQSAINSRGLAKAEMYPSLQITAEGGLNSFKASNWFNIPASLFGLVVGSVAKPLILHRQLKSQYDVAKLEQEKSVIQFRQTVLQAVSEVSDAMLRIQKLKEQESILAQRVLVLRQASSHANLLVKNGMANYLEVITAQSNVLQSELELASVRRDEFGAAAELYRSLGGGWK